MENLCDRPLFTGYTRDGGFATHTIADSRYAFPLGEDSDDVAIAPLLCAGLIGWRSLVMAGSATRLGIYGFGAAGHIVAQIARWQGRSVYAFTRSGDIAAQDFARKLGVAWAGASDQLPRRAARCCDHLRPRRGIGARGATRGAQGRPSGMCGDSHERHTELSVRPALGRTTAGIGCQSHTPGRAGFPERSRHAREFGPRRRRSRCVKPTMS